VSFAISLQLTPSVSWSI